MYPTLPAAPTPTNSPSIYTHTSTNQPVNDSPLV